MSGQRFERVWRGLAWPLACLLIASATAAAETRYVALELYLKAHDDEGLQAAESLNALFRQRRGVSLRTYDLQQDEEAQGRFQQIASYYGIDEASHPVVYGCNQVIVGFSDAATFRGQTEAMLRLDVYTRAGCARCERAKSYLPGFQRKYPGLQVRVCETVYDRRAREELQRLAQRHQTAAASFPVFHLCNQLVVGFASEWTTGQRLDSVLSRWTFPAPPQRSESVAPGTVKPSPAVARRPTAALIVPPATPLLLKILAAAAGQQETTVPPGGAGLPPPPLPPPPLPLPLPPPGDNLTAVTRQPPPPLDIDPPGPGGPPAAEDQQDTVDVPVFGRLSATALGLPAFTLAIGLVDGFNPCAMWVLLFLLSILVNLRDRWKILAVAGTFVVISGLAYFAFMAAWLNVFLIVGMLRGAQITLGLLAVGVGAIHVKDFFAFRRGISLSIPEAAKPGIYARVRRIVTAENLAGAVAGAAVLAVLVNIIELLCTAGLPALYTEVLSLQQFPAWKNYLYLALYNAAYMLDDGLMVAVVVVTLGRRKMQETQGRWLKLVSGAAILVLGLVMLLQPDWLV